MWTTIKYEIEKVWISQTPGASRPVWFLDAIQVDDDGRKSSSNICSGEEHYCRRTLAKIWGLP